MHDGSGRFAHQDAAERFWQKVNKTPSCWLWVGTCNWKGYGQFWFEGKNRMAHRFAYELEHGPLPSQQVLDHVCFTPDCVRSSHLRRVTVKQNSEHRNGAQSNSQSGVRGVHWHKKRQEWRAKVVHHGRHIQVGSYGTKREAEVAVIAKRRELFTHDDAEGAGS